MEKIIRRRPPRVTTVTLPRAPARGIAGVVLIRSTSTQTGNPWNVIFSSEFGSGSSAARGTNQN